MTDQHMAPDALIHTISGEEPAAARMAQDPTAEWVPEVEVAIDGESLQKVHAALGDPTSLHVDVDTLSAELVAKANVTPAIVPSELPEPARRAGSRLRLGIVIGVVLVLAASLLLASTWWVCCSVPR